MQRNCTRKSSDEREFMYSISARRIIHFNTCFSLGGTDCVLHAINVRTGTMIQAHCLTSQPVRSLPGQTRTLKNSRISGSPVLRRQQSPISKLNVREAGRVAPPTVKTKATSSNASGVQQQDRDLKHIVQKFCPVFVFHPKVRTVRYTVGLTFRIAVSAC